MYRPVQYTQPQVNSVRNSLFSQNNYDTLQTVLIQDFQKRNNAPLSDQQVDRLSKTLDHYIKQIYSVQGDKPVTFLNKEILSASAQDFAKYMQRKDISNNRPATAVKTVMDETLFQDTSQRFERLAQERNEVKALPPSIPDFRISLAEDGPTSVDLYERAKKQRELEALRQAASQPTQDPNIQKYVNANDQFNNIQAAQNRSTEMALYERRNQKNSSLTDAPLAVMPDRRELLLAPIGSFEPSPSPRELGNANSNMTIVQPEFNDPFKRDLPQNYVQREDKIISYREVENNLFIYSADRDWLLNTKENRYNFTVNFDPGHINNKYGPNPAAQMKFKNIVRIELVKAIMPAEGLDVLIRRDENPPQNNTSFQENILSFPYITVRVDELDNNNNYGTDNSLDRAFGVLQYDANWISDAININHHHSRGYLAMIPKFLKCQKEYYPTPLSTLQKMTIQLDRPNGELVSHTHDTFNIASIIGSDWIGNISMPFYDADLTTSMYGITAPAFPSPPATAPAYFFIRTETFFSRFQISIGDRIQLGGYTFNDAVLNSATYGETLRGFVNWINNPNGHIVAAIGYNDGATFYDGPNDVGYANYIIIQARYNDPSTGSTDLLPFGTDISQYIADNNTGLLSPRRLIDHNKQLSLVFRIITREMDSNPQIRPDNNY